MRMLGNTQQQLDKIKNGSLNGQPVTETAEEGQWEHSSTKPDFHGSSINTKTTMLPFCGIWLCQAGVKKLTILQESKKQGAARQLQFLPEQ